MLYSLAAIHPVCKINFIDFPVDSVKHGNTRKHPDQIVDKYSKSPTVIYNFHYNPLPIAVVVHVYVKLDMVSELCNA